jgi:hypothetical protein
MSLYQKVIEYYSAINDSQFEEYLMKMHQFLNSPAVLRVLKAESIEETNTKVLIDKVEDDFLS